VTASPSTDTDRIGDTSRTIPLPVDRPAKQCPPLRTAQASPCRRASATTSATSSADAQRTTATGRTSEGSGAAGRWARS
jgi:hypothetical protein